VPAPHYGVDTGSRSNNPDHPEMVLPAFFGPECNSPELMTSEDGSVVNGPRVAAPYRQQITLAG